jgi:hypothetical protein
MLIDFPSNEMLQHHLTYMLFNHLSSNASNMGAQILFMPINILDLSYASDLKETTLSLKINPVKN